MDNVFQMLAQQEIDRPQRKLQELQAQMQQTQLKKMQEDQAYQEGARNAMKGPSLASLGPMAGGYQPTQPSSLDQVLQPPQAQAAPSIVDQFKRQYDYHVANGRPDLAEEVMGHQVELSMKAAKVADHIYKTGGKEGLTAWLQANPTFAPLLGDPSKMHLTKDGVLFPATDEKGQPVPGMYWHRDENDRPVFKEVKPQESAGDTAGFQSAIAGLSGPSTAGTLSQLGNTGITTPYSPLSEVEKDIRMAGSTYKVKGEEINKAVDDARNLYKDTYVQGQRVKPNGSKSAYTPEYNLMGQQKDVGKTTDVVVKVNGSGKTGHGGMNIKMNGLSPQQTEALTAAIGEGRLDPYKINSKNQQILADTALANPGINLNDIAANLGLARSKDVQMKGAIAETVPPLLKSIVDNGKKLNYSDNQFIGMAQQWLDKKTNNPQFVKYMTLRNDQLLTLGGIMRSNGMTDMAQRLEEEAAHPTMSPRALQGWLEGQMESVDPRLKMYRSIREGKGAPRPNEKAPVVTKGGFKVTVVK